MKLFTKCKDGGPESTVFAHILCEFKSLFSVMLLEFRNGSRDAYHSHAFDCVSWVLKGKLKEDEVDEFGYHTYTEHRPSLLPIITLRETTHKVTSEGTTWVLTFRGPWAKVWKEIMPDGEEVVLSHGRRKVYGQY